MRRQRLGQHFLTSQSLAKKIVDAANITKKDAVLEIGTGQGILVPYLCEKADSVVSVDSDYSLYEDAKKKFSGITNLTLTHGDGFKIDSKFTAFVSNLPYSQSRDAIEWLAQKKWKKAIVMIQKEFYEKLVATGKKRKAISIISQHCFAIEKIMNVGMNNFSPPPKVDSVVIRLEQKKSISKEMIHTINKLYSYKRKTIQNIFKQFGKSIKSDKRLDELSSEEIVNIAKKILK